MQRLYNDACDEGLAVRSPQTGREVRFSYNRTEKDSEGDVIKWVYDAVDSDQPIKNVIIFND